MRLTQEFGKSQILEPTAVETAQDLVESHPWASILSPQFDSTAFWQSLCSYSEKRNHLYADSFPEVLTLLQDKIIS